ncbi:hypothetical protein BH747_04050 [Enterococcus villorum]|uniref:DarT domain-containing protein n=2 Tax=Enterococcus villorum TaxID=112904 RepID=A0A1V8YF59_9ENTE|nr:hypothetical protein BH747_04050 [Enterococcus villorum]OQO75012.1 hypothetical protein BH744_06360 [Enterococcus villorum]
MIRNETDTLYHITKAMNVKSIEKYGLVGAFKARKLMEKETGGAICHFNNQTYNTLVKYAPDDLDIYRATFMFDKESSLKEELAPLVNDPCFLEIEASYLDKDCLKVCNSAIASRLMNYSKLDQEKLAVLYWKTAMPYEIYRSNKEKVLNIFERIGILYQPEYVYFKEIPSKHILNLNTNKRRKQENK